MKAEEYIARYGLNNDQAAVLCNVAKMFDGESQFTPVVTLVHGKLDFAALACMF